MVRTVCILSVFCHSFLREALLINARIFFLKDEGYDIATQDATCNYTVPNRDFSL